MDYKRIAVLSLLFTIFAANIQSINANYHLKCFDSTFLADTADQQFDADEETTNSTQATQSNQTQISPEEENHDSDSFFGLPELELSLSNMTIKMEREIDTTIYGEEEVTTFAMPDTSHDSCPSANASSHNIIITSGHINS